MATTTNYGWTTPDDTALVKDGASAIRSLGTSIDTAMNTALGTKKAGMVLLNTTSFSGVASQSLNNVFSATYRNYRVVLDYVPATTSGVVTLRLRASGADNSTANYQRTIIYLGTSPTVAYSRNTNATSIDLNGSTANAYYSTVFDLITPFAALHTQAIGLNAYKATSADNEINALQFGFNGTTSFDGISVLSSGSNLTGSISVYGYNA